MLGGGGGVVGGGIIIRMGHSSGIGVFVCMVHSR